MAQSNKNAPTTAAWLSSATLILTASNALADNRDYEELPAMIVEGQRSQPGILEALPDMSGMSDTAELIKQVPGADINRLGPLSGNAQYRGMSGPRLNVSVDGFVPKDVGPDGMTPPLSNMSAHHAQSVTVYRGITPVSVGMETIGGAIKATSQKGRFSDGDEIDFSGRFSTGFANAADSWFGNLLTSVANQNHRLEFNGSREEGDSYTFKDDKRLLPSDYNRDIFSLGYGYNRGPHELALKYTDINTTNTGTPSLLMDIIYARGGIWGINYSNDLGQGRVLDASFHYQDMRHYMNNTDLRSPRMLHGDMVMDMTHNANTGLTSAGGDINLTMPFQDGILKAGFNVDQSTHNSDMTMAFGPMMHHMPDGSMHMMPGGVWDFNLYNDVDRQRFSPYLEWEGNIDEQWSLNLGGRYTYVYAEAGQVEEYTSTHDGAVSALADDFNNSRRRNEQHLLDLSAILRYALNEHMDLELGFARKNRAPSYQELFLWLPDEANGGLGDAQVYIGNQNLRPEVAHQIELGFDWHGDRFHMAPRVFYQNIDDYIQGIASDDTTINLVAMQHGNGPALQFGNVDARIFGFDTDWGYAFDEHWHLDGTISYVRGQRRNGRDNLYRMAPLHGNAILSFQQSDWMVAAETVAYASQGDVSAYNQERKTPGYVLLNLRGHYKPSYLKGMSIGMGLENVFDKVRYDHLAGLNRVVDNPNLAPNQRIPGLGRNFFITMNYQW